MRAHLRQRGVARHLAPQPGERFRRARILVGKQPRVAALGQAGAARMLTGRAALEDTLVGYRVERIYNGSGANDISVVSRRMQS